MANLRVEIWSDVVCPWCYIGKRRFEHVLADWPHARDVEIVWRAFELDPKAPRVSTDARSHAERLAAKYGMSVQQAEARIAEVAATAAREGLDFHLARASSSNTFDAHRLIHFALAHGGAAAQGALKERLMRAYFTDGRPIGDPAVLAELAGETGLPTAEAQAVLASDRFADEVRRDERLAREFGISGVPFFLLGGLVGVSGAQPADILRSALDRAWAELADAVA